MPRSCNDSDCKDIVEYKHEGKYYCFRHMIDGSVKCKTKAYCQTDGCQKRSSYNISGSKIAIACKSHKEMTHINIKNKICKELNCNNQASFGFKNSVVQWCSKHKETSAINLGKKCKYDTCCTVPTYGKIGTRRAEYCREHCPDGYIDVINKRCIYDKCLTLANFGKPGSKVEYCSKHCPDGYIDLKKKACKYQGCNKSALFGIKGSNVVERCKLHKTIDDVMIHKITCNASNCELTASYGNPITKLKKWCTSHKSSDDIDLSHKQCTEPNCNKIANFGDPEIKLLERCSKHKLINHINLNSKRCLYPECELFGSYDDINLGKDKWCSKHQPDHSKHLKSHKMCKFLDCMTHASFGLRGHTTTFCAKHMTDEMVPNPTKYKKDEVKLCEFCATEIHYTDQFCKSCKVYIQNGKVTLKKIRKEETIKYLLESNEIKFTHDLVVKGGCSKKRPDFIIQSNNGTIILEVDEEQHNRKSYSCICEITRMKQLYFDVGVENLIFVRYNPDSYEIDCGKPLSNKKRQEYLINLIKRYINQIPDKLNVVYLFYDKFVQSDTLDVEPIDPYH